LHDEESHLIMAQEDGFNKTTTTQAASPTAGDDSIT